MKKTIGLVAAMLLLATGLVEAQQAQPPGVVQLFMCQFNEGKTADDAFALMEELGARVTERLPGFSLFLWLPMRGNYEADYVWGVTSTDLDEMATGLDSYYADSAAFMNPRFAAVNERCSSVVTLAKRVKDGAIGNTGDRTPDAVVETFACSVNAGSTMADVNSAVDFWKTQVASLGSDALGKYEATLLTPFRGGDSQVDFAWVGASPNLATWARGASEYYESKAGQAADARFNKVSRCRNALWSGFWIVPPAAQ